MRSQIKHLLDAATDLEVSVVTLRKALGIKGPDLTPPAIQSFTVDNSSITTGQFVVLNASTTNATLLTLNGVVTTFPVTLSPTVTTAYQLVATGPGGTATSSLVVTVTAPIGNTPVYRGYFDHVTSTGCTGWAADVANVSNKLTLSIRLNGAEVTQVVANVFRSDVLAAGQGDGFSGFTATFTTPTTPGSYIVSVVALGTGFTLGLASGSASFFVSGSTGGGGTPPSTGTGGSGNFADRAQGAVFAIAGNKQADLGSFQGTNYLNQTDATCYTDSFSNNTGARPVYDPVKNAIKFPIPANNTNASPSGAWWIQFTPMDVNGNDCYWLQFRAQFNANYLNTVFRNGNGSVQQGLKIFTAGPRPNPTSLPFAGTSTYLKTVLTYLWGYRALHMYRRSHRSVESDDNLWATHIESEFPACVYPDLRPGGTDNYPVPHAPQCMVIPPDVWGTFLVKIKHGPRITNPDIGVALANGQDPVPQVFDQTEIWLWFAPEGATSYTLIHKWAPGADGYTPYFNAMLDYFVAGVRNWHAVSTGQIVFETYMTPEDLFAVPQLLAPGVESAMWIKEFIVQRKDSTLAPEQAIPLPTPDSPIDPAWTVGLPYEQPVELSVTMGQLVAYEGPTYHPWNTAANNPTNGKQLIYDQDGLNAWGPLFWDDVNTHCLYGNAAGHSSDRVQKTSVEIGDFSLAVPTWQAPLNPSADFSEAAGIAHGEPPGPVAGVDTCRSSHYDNGDPAAQHSFGQADWVMPMLEGPRIVIPTNRAATRQSEPNHPAPSNNAYRVNQKRWFGFGKDLNGVRRPSIIDYIGGADMSNYSSSAQVPGTRIGYYCVPNSNTQYLFKYEEFENGSCEITPISSDPLLVKTEGAGMLIDADRDRIVFSFNYVDSTSSNKYMIVGENLSSGSPTFRSVEIVGPGAAYIYVPSVNANQKIENAQHSRANDTYYFLQSVTFNLVAVTPPSSVATTATSRYVCTMPFPTGNVSLNINRQFHYFPRPRTLVYIGQFFRGPIVISTDPNRH